MAMDEKIFLLLKSNGDSIESDEFGNTIVYGEASNENLDFQGDKVLQEALLDSADYFMQNGVVSYDHRHLTEKENPEKFIIGEPLGIRFKETKEGGKKVFVKFKLFKNNELANEIVKKLKDGANTVKISIGGKLAKKEASVTDGAKRIVSVLWDEIALTYKPVNQTLSPVTLSSREFVKSLMAGEGAGENIVREDLQGAGSDGEEDDEERRVIVDALNYALSRGVEPEEYLEALKKRVSQETLKKIEKEMKRMKKGKNLMKALDEGLDELLKAHGGEEEPEEDFEEPDEEEEEEMKSQEDEWQEEEDDELTGEEEEDEEEEDEEEEEAEDSEDEDMEELKAENKALKKSVSELRRSIKAQNERMAKMFRIMKSFSDSPAQRKAQVTKSQRFQQKSKKFSKEEILRKAQTAVREQRISVAAFCGIEDRLNKGMEIGDDLLKSIM